MVGECHDDSIIQRGIEEAMACQDMLARAPVPLSRWGKMAARVGGLGQSLTRQIRRHAGAQPRFRSVYGRGATTQEARHG
jgi:hypothetical protein